MSISSNVLAAQEAAFIPGNSVFDVADPERCGKIIRPGPEVSEVRFDDGAERNVSNVHLRAAEAPIADNERLPRTTDPEQTAIRCGQEAWSRLKKGSTFEDWKHVGAAHVIGR